MELHENTEKQERALLVAVDTGSYDVEASLAELYELTKTAGAEPFGAMTQKRPAYETATCVGSGMIQEIADICQKQEIDLLIFDCELSPTQIRNIEDITNVRVIDRTMLILDIFAARAVSKEGKLQVELAQLKYMLPRLTGKGAALRRLACFWCGLLCGGKIAVIHGSAPPIRLAARYRLQRGSPVRVPRAPSEPC